MPLTLATDPRERGTTRLIQHVAMLDRLMREPRRCLSDVLENELGGETARLALAAVGAQSAPARPGSGWD